MDQQIVGVEDILSNSDGVLEVEDNDLDSNAAFPYSPHNPKSYESLVFKDVDKAYDFYKAFGMSRGFEIRYGARHWRNEKNSNTEYIHYVYLECSKEGETYKRKDPSKEVTNERAVKRTGCLAKLRVKMDWVKRGYVIYEWTDEHTHPLMDLDKTHLFRSNRKIKNEHKIMIDLHLNNGISVRSTFDALRDTYGKVQDMGFTRKDLWNYVSSVKRKDMFAGDAAVMHKWLRDQSTEKPGFYYNIEVDEERRIKSVFWADAVMINDFAKFGDFVSFDTTYRTNQTARPLGIFVGFNHHKCTTIFGAALMYDETASSFRWVFESFLKCMDSKFPKTIMTDQAPAIALAIRDVFPGVFHALCSWHIGQNARKRLGSLATDTFLDFLNQLFRYVDTEEEFDFVWQRMLEVCFNGNPTSDNSWLSFIFSFRTQWSSAWVKDNFTAGKTTTQLSEQLNAFARHYLKHSLNVSEMMRRFQQLVDDLRFNEQTRDFFMKDTTPANKFKNSSLMIQAASLFTPRVFKYIQHEYDTGMSYTIKETKDLERFKLKISFQETMRICTGACKLILVQRWENRGLQDQSLIEEELVRMDIGESSIKCSCRFFENSWFICRHVLRVMDVYDALGEDFCRTIPKEFILERWLRSSAKPCSLKVIETEDVPSSHGKRYLRLYNNVVAVGTRICYNVDAYSTFMSYFYQGSKAADDILKNQTSKVAPSRAECSSALDGDEEYLASFKTKKPRTGEKNNKVRLMSNVETRHLKWKQRLRREMASPSSD